jgi:uncharacterized membrane protein YqaE (UPF0057 family)
MKYPLAILLPPMAVLLYGSLRQPGRPSQFVLCLVLTCCFWIPGVVFAFWVVKGHLAKCRRTDRLIAAIRGADGVHRSFRLTQP